MKIKASWLSIAGVISMAGVATAKSFDPAAIFDFSITPSEAPFAAELGSGGPDYLIVGLEATDQSTGNSDSFFEEFDVPAASDYAVTINNGAGDDTGNLSDAGYFLSPTEIPLDQLNFGFSTPPFSPGSPFIPLPSLDGTSLPGGDGIGFDASVPEPASLTILGAGALVLIRRRRNR